MMDKDLIAQISRLERQIEELKAGEFANHNDPFWAYNKSMEYLRSRVGYRYISGGGYNANEAPSSPVANLTVVNVGSGDAVWKMHSTRGYPYLQFDQSQTHYMYSNFTTWSGLWGVDAGVFSWSRNPGITAGAWVNIDSMTTLDQGIIAGWNAQVTQGAWRILIDSEVNSDVLRIGTSNTGSYDATQEIIGTDAVPTGRWVFLGMRWDAGVELKSFLYDGDTKITETLTTSIDSDVFNGEWLFVGAYRRSTGDNRTLNGSMGMRFFHVTAWNDWEIEYFYEMSRNIYGV